MKSTSPVRNEQKRMAVHFRYVKLAEVNLDSLPQWLKQQRSEIVSKGHRRESGQALRQGDARRPQLRTGLQFHFVDEVDGDLTGCGCSALQ